jgi:voltage-gated potassium channel Kch
VIIFFHPAFSGFRTLFRNIIFTAMILSGIYSLNFAPTTRRLLIASGTVCIILVWSDYLTTSEVLDFVSLLAIFCFNVFITVSMTQHVAKSKHVNATIIINSINCYLLIGMLGALLLVMLEIFYDTQAFNLAGKTASGFHDMLYFSFVTMTTLGYGDITPITPTAKSLTTLIAVVGQLYLTILIAMLVGKYLSGAGKKESGS